MSISEDELILKEWIREKLIDMLSFQIPDEMVDYIYNIRSDEELRKHLKELLNPKDPGTRKFIDELIKRRHFRHAKLVEKNKVHEIDDVRNKYQVQLKKQKIPDNIEIGFQKEFKKGESSQAGVESHRKKNKFKTLSVKDPTTVLLKGRHYCNCEAKTHNLINNCLTCGRIVCEQEGSGPCCCCGSLVCTPEELAQFNSDTSQGSKLYEKLLTREKPKGLDEAMVHRDKLLDFDKNIRKHTHVFDDDSDYFCATNPWLTLDQRENMRKQEEEFFSKKYDRRNKKINFTLQGNEIIQEEVKENISYPSEEKHDNDKSDRKSPVKIDLSLDIVDRIIDPYFSSMNIKFMRSLKSRNLKTKGNIVDIGESRILDEDKHQLVDKGYCLSIRQPWASFLVHGIKNGEGRTWYTSHRGKLWIASSGHKVPQSEIETLQKSYRFIKKDVKFPADYPIGCLLGCVDITECLTQEQYSTIYPDGEIEDPYVFICENPVALPIQYPIKGYSNIFALDEKIHQAAVACFKRIQKNMSESKHKVKFLQL